MRKSQTSLLTLLVPTLFTSFASAQNLPRPTRHEYVASEVLVKFKDRVSSRRRHRLMGERGHVKIRDIGEGGRTSRIRLESSESVEEAVDFYRRDPDVEYAEPNYVFHLKAVPNDPRFGSQWGFSNSGQSVSTADTFGSTIDPASGSAGSDMGLTAAWDLVNDCSSVPVAVIDSGVQYNHEDLLANMWSDPSFPQHGYSTVDANGLDPIDWNGHGTHVASIIGARGDNSVGGVGVCWKANIMAVRSADAQGALTASDVTEAVDWARLHGAKVMNMSFATNSRIDSLKDAVTNAASAGIVVIAAAGNDGMDNDLEASSYPCDYDLPNIVCVAALDPTYKLADFSNYGSTSVDVGAPGVNIVAGWAGTLSTDAFSSGFAGWQLNGGWTARNFTDTTTGTLLPVLTNPNNWMPDGTGSNYGNNLDARAWKNFDQACSGSSCPVGLSYETTVSFSLASDDILEVAVIWGNADPFGVSGTVRESYSGVSGDSIIGAVIEEFRNQNFSLGFRMKTNSSGVDKGVALYDFALNRMVSATNKYRVEQGTSMAAPHVSGLAALLLSYNPGYTALDVVDSIKNGGVAIGSLSGKTSTGKAANAMGSLAYIQAPTGVTASVQ